ncbi:MAG: hypothetical protein IJX63_07325 [Lachnospiraceae bacterium]|nr:hypothetical protein [Lachnospiraceae bacterium]
MNRKMLPLIMMLVAGAITSIATYIRNFTMLEKLVALLVTLLIFYGLGFFLEHMLDSFEKQNEEVRLAQEAAAAEQEQEAQVNEEQK